MMEVQESRDRQTAQLKPPVSDSQMREWETKASAWLSTLPKRRYVNTDEMDSWIELNQTFIPEDLKTMPRSQLYGRILSIHKRIRRPNPEQALKPQQSPWNYQESTKPIDFSTGKTNIKAELAAPNQIISSKIPTTQANNTQSNGGYGSDLSHLPQSQSIKEQRRSEDGYNWRKYGQKQVKGSENSRSYYRCTYPSCPTKKTIKRSLDGHITEIVYNGSHNHPKPQSTRRRKSSSQPIQSIKSSLVFPRLCYQENDISQPELSVPRFPSLQENDISQLELDISQPELSEPLFPSLQENDISQPELSQPRFPSLQEIDISQPDLSQPRFQRTDQWKPVYSWLESLDRNEVLKAREIDDWLSENPAIKDQLYSRHSRNHLIHYVQRCHLKMLRRRDKLKKKGSKPFTTRTPTKVHNNAVSTVSVPLPCNFSSNLVKVNEISLAKKNEAFLRYELFTELKDQLTSLLSKPKHVINLKESGSPSLLRQKSAEATNHDGLSVASNEERNIRVMSGNVSHTQNAESFPSSGKSRLRSPLDSKSGRKS